jgi:L-seryl-tRNA(Ser) seleniumtransferase
MISEPLEQLRRRAECLANALTSGATQVTTAIQSTQTFLGSGSLPAEAIPSVAVALQSSKVSADEFAKRLRLDPACVFGRIEAGRLLLDMRTVTDAQVAAIAEAVVRATQTTGNTPT